MTEDEVYCARHKMMSLFIQNIVYVFINEDIKLLEIMKTLRVLRMIEFDNYIKENKHLSIEEITINVIIKIEKYNEELNSISKNNNQPPPIDWDKFLSLPLNHAFHFLLKTYLEVIGLLFNQTRKIKENFKEISDKISYHILLSMIDLEKQFDDTYPDLQSIEEYILSKEHFNNVMLNHKTILTHEREFKISEDILDVSNKNTLH